MKPAELLFFCFKSVYLEKGWNFRKVKCVSLSVRLKLFLKTLKESFGVWSLLKMLCLSPCFIKKIMLVCAVSWNYMQTFHLRSCIHLPPKFLWIRSCRKRNIKEKAPSLPRVLPLTKAYLMHTVSRGTNRDRKCWSDSHPNRVFRFFF